MENTIKTTATPSEILNNLGMNEEEFLTKVYELRNVDKMTEDAIAEKYDISRNQLRIIVGHCVIALRLEWKKKILDYACEGKTISEISEIVGKPEAIVRIIIGTKE